MGTNSVWMQLPLLTAELPEHWNLPSYLAAVVQIACIAPLIYTVLHKGVKSFTLPTPPLIVAFLLLACACQLGLVFLWQNTAVVFGTERSLPLYLLLFGLAIVNAMSSVLFLPFMAQFHPAYLNAYFHGMGLSALIPSVLSLIQGTSNYECIGSIPHYFPPRFSVSIFFLVIFLWTCLATASFGALYISGAHTHEHSKKVHEGTPLNENLSSNSNRSSPCSSPELNETGSPAVDTITTNAEESKTVESSMITGFEYVFLLFLTALVNAQMNGIIPSIQSYAALPYSQDTYHYGITFSNVVSPLASFAPFFLSIRSLPILGTMTATSSLVTSFIIYLAALSPNLIFNSQGWGSVLSITSAVVAAGLHSYLRVVFASLLREGNQSESRLFWCGVFIQIGSFIGSAVMFPLVNVFGLFRSAQACPSP
ncbi:unnamed protein product [Caenorhabditis auriculariae]|uniref:Riboflavin transporter n=1 Tax=Caenorhabditis auriculariae TaxID=2777116 RepID=A0A8S1HGA4_9PELO|nr:unnamed protein product [Caenorhabditis auriculariae]